MNGARRGTERGWLAPAGWVIAGLLFVFIVFSQLRPERTSPAASPSVSATAAPEAAPAQPAAAPPETVPQPLGQAPASPSAVPPGPSAAAASPAPAASPGAASPAAIPTPDAAALERAALEQQFRQRIAEARSRMESRQSAFAQQCPDLKPGELRLPEGVAQCMRLQSDATAAVNDYESLKQQAREAGFSIQ